MRVLAIYYTSKKGAEMCKSALIVGAAPVSFLELLTPGVAAQLGYYG